MKDEAERKAYEQGQEDGYSRGWAAGNEHEDALDAEIAKLKAEFVRGLERAREIAANFWYEREDFDDAIQAEIDKAKGNP